MTELPPPEIIELVRLEKNVPEHYAVTMCENECGDIVFYPPDVVEAAKKVGMGHLIVCSAKCSAEWLEKHEPKAPEPPCAHETLDAECEGWENPSEPLSIRVTCVDCGKHIDVTVEDPSLLDWEDD